MRKSLRHDLSTRIGLVILCISIVIGAVYYFFSIRFYENEFNSYINKQTENISNTFTMQLWLFDLSTTLKLCDLIFSTPEITGLRLLDHKKKVIFEQKPSKTRTNIHINKELHYEGKDLVGYLDIYYSNISWKQQRNNILFIGVCMVLGIILGSFLLINILLKRYLAKPLANLQDSMNELAQGNYYQSELVEQKTEIQNIIDTFNNLALNLKQRDEEIYRKTGDLKKEIIERQNTENLLRQSQQQWERTFNAMSDMITIHNSDMEILQANKATFDFFQLKVEDVIGKHCYELFRGVNEPCSNCSDLQTLKNNTVNDTTITHKKLGNIFHIISSPVSDVKGELLHTVHITRDITNQERMKAELFQAHKTEAIGTLAGGIAHDFNNILAAILGYAEMARDDSPRGSTVVKDLDKVLEAGNRAKGLVQQILSFSRQNNTEKHPLQLTSVVEEAIKMLRPSLPATIEINQNIESNVGLIFADPTQIHQIVMNLGTNAFHAMEETGGKLDILLKETILSAEDLAHEPGAKAGTFVQLSICDSGPGIAPDIRENIFDPYFTTKETGKGTGLGLSIVHGIVKNYGGFVSLDSKFREGTTFHVFLPVMEEPTQPDENKIIEQIPVGKERILFIDDEKVLADMGKDMLERLGYHVTVRNSSIEALTIFQNQPDQFELIITDQTMPGMTGYDLAEQMLQIRPDIPIILCTGYSTIISEEKSKSLGIKEFAFKPIAKRDIAVLIRKVLDTQ